LNSKDNKYSRECNKGIKTSQKAEVW